MEKFNDLEYVDRLWLVLLGQYPPRPPRQIPLITSICYYSLSIIIGRLLRLFAKQFCPSQHLLPFLLDAIFTFQILACSLENGQIRKHYGMGAYALVLFTLSMWHQMTVQDGQSANPCAHVVTLVNGSCSFVHFILRVAFQTAGGLLSYQYARLFWSLEFTDSHGARYWASSCLADLSVSPSLGFLLEAGGTLLETALALTTFTPFYLMEASTKTMLGCWLTVLGVGYTGYYLNPINATNQTFGCKGVSNLQHFVIYWLGPMLSTAIVVKLHPILMGYWQSYSVQSSKRLLAFSPSMTFDELGIAAEDVNFEEAETEAIEKSDRNHYESNGHVNADVTSVKSRRQKKRKSNHGNKS